MSYSDKNRAWDRMLRGLAKVEVQPPRCVECHEPVSMAKRDCACTRAAREHQGAKEAVTLENTDSECPIPTE